MSAPTVNARRAVAVNAGKLTALASRAVGRGGGTALPGLVASRVYSNVARDLAGQLECGSFLVSGTNGKTTTARILATILREANFSPLRNQSGSNLMRGVASSLVQQADLWGNVRSRPRGLGLFEVDEAALPGLLRALRPRGLLLLDLFRDQLDRYGEVATVAGLWSAALDQVDGSTGLIVNADDPLLAQATFRKPPIPIYFGIHSADRTLATLGHASDVKACPRCGGPIAYTCIFLGHLGHYACPACGLTRPKPILEAHGVRLHGVDASSFRLVTEREAVDVSLPLPGMYNVYNALGAATSAVWLGISLGTVAKALALTTPAFGRMEKLHIDGRTVVLALAKNPTGLNEVLRTAVEGDMHLNLMMMLNDNIADGHDVSWIWDADVELLAGRVSSVMFSGIRAPDMALRFKYAGVTGDDTRVRWEVNGFTDSAFQRALATTPPSGTLIIVPTYTALLDIRNTLTRLGHVKAYWEE